LDLTQASFEDVTDFRQVDPKYTGGDLQEARKFMLSNIFESKDRQSTGNLRAFPPDKVKFGQTMQSVKSKNVALVGTQHVKLPSISRN